MKDVRRGSIEREMVGEKHSGQEEAPAYEDGSVMV